MNEEILQAALGGFLPVSFAARVYGRSEATIRTWVRAGDIGTMRVGGRLLVKERDIGRVNPHRGHRRRKGARS